MRAKENVHADAARGLIYRQGTTTIDHASAILGLPRSTAHEVLSSLERSRDADRRDRKLPWQKEHRGAAPAHYLLSTRNQAAGILAGAVANDVPLRGREDKKRALARYGMCNVPYGIPHAWLRNALFAGLAVSSGNLGPGLRISVPVEEQWGESYSGFPLAGGIRKCEPDGACKVVWEDDDGELAQGFWVEAETKGRREEVLEKINVYASRWLEFRTGKLGEKTRHFQKFYGWNEQRAGEEAVGGVSIGFEGLRPVLFLYPDRKTASLMRLYVSKAALSKDARLHAYLRLKEQWEQYGLSPGHFFLFCGLDEIRERGPFAGELGGESGCFMPATPFDADEGGYEVPLYAPVWRLWYAYSEEERVRMGEAAQEKQIEERRRTHATAARKVQAPPQS